MILHIDPKILDIFDNEKLYIFFYNSWCEWTKINIIKDFNEEWLEYIKIWENFFYYNKEDTKHLDWWKIILKTNQELWHKTDDKYIFISSKIKSRCSCSTSFSFEEKLVNSSKLKKLKSIFSKNK